MKKIEKKVLFFVSWWSAEPKRVYICTTISGNGIEGFEVVVQVIFGGDNRGVKGF